uniref:Uncharacterized protein n=1 Tax=Ignisphaera aggregans TaxID=334771 RepID=A0A7J3Z8J3_9CREN
MNTVRKSSLAVLLIGIAIAVAWPVATYLLYPVPSEDVEAIASVSDVPLPERPPGFMVGVGGMLMFRGSGIEVRGVSVYSREGVAVVKLESGEVVTVVFMPRYRCAGVEQEVAGFELQRLVVNKSTVFKGHMFLTRRGWVLILLDVSVNGVQCFAAPRHR